MCWVKMQACVHALVRAQKRRLECKTIYQLELFPHYDSSSGLSAFLNSEVAVLESKHVCVLAKEPI